MALERGRVLRTDGVTLHIHTVGRSERSLGCSCNVQPPPYPLLQTSKTVNAAFWERIVSVSEVELNPVSKLLNWFAPNPVEDGGGAATVGLI